MNPHHGFPPRDSSLSPPRYLPKNPRPPLPVIPLNTNFTRPINTKSPVRRKPLPSSALSPTYSNSSYSRGASPELLEQKIEPLSAVTNIVDSNVRDLDRYSYIPGIDLWPHINRTQTSSRTNTFTRTDTRCSRVLQHTCQSRTFFSG